MDNDATPLLDDLRADLIAVLTRRHTRKEVWDATTAYLGAMKKAETTVGRRSVGRPRDPEKEARALERARRMLVNAEANYKAASARLQNAENYARLSKGFNLEPSPDGKRRLMNAQAAMAQAQARLENAKLRLAALEAQAAAA